MPPETSHSTGRQRPFLSDEQFKALGRMTYWFSELEAVIEEAICMALGREGTVTRMVPPLLSFSRKIDLVTSLLKHRVKEPEKVARLEGLFKRATAAEEERNTLVHSEWWPGGSDRVPIRAKSTTGRRKGYKIHIHVMSDETIGKVADEIEDVRNEIAEAITELAKAHLLPGGVDVKTRDDTGD